MEPSCGSSYLSGGLGRAEIVCRRRRLPWRLREVRDVSEYTDSSSVFSPLVGYVRAACFTFVAAVLFASIRDDGGAGPCTVTLLTLGVLV